MFPSISLKWVYPPPFQFDLLSGILSKSRQCQDKHFSLCLLPTFTNPLTLLLGVTGSKFTSTLRASSRGGRASSNPRVAFLREHPPRPGLTLSSKRFLKYLPKLSINVYTRLKSPYTQYTKTDDLSILNVLDLQPPLGASIEIVYV